MTLSSFERSLQLIAELGSYVQTLHVMQKWNWGMGK